MYASIEQVRELVAFNRPLIIAGDESFLRLIPKGNWIGGTTPYFMTPDGGQISRSHAYVTEVPACHKSAHIKVYDEKNISQIGVESPENGYSVVIVPGFTPIHQRFALEAPSYDQLFLKVVAGWIAGIHLDDLGKMVPKVFDGTTGKILGSESVALHVELPAEYHAKLGIVNIFEQGDGDDILFPSNGFEASECIIAGKRQSIAEAMGRLAVDTRFPLVANYCGTKCNVTILSLDIAKNNVSFAVPVFENVSYRLARPVGNYSEKFMAAIPADIGEVVFSCNCLHNFLYGELLGRRTGTMEGPIAFGEIAYQLLNQTLVYITVEKKS